MTSAGSSTRQYTPGRTWQDGEIAPYFALDQAMDRLSWLQRGLAGRVFSNTDFLASQGGWVGVPFNLERFDTNQFFDFSQDKQHMVINTPGIYLVGLGASHGQDTVGSRRARLVLNDIMVLTAHGPVPPNANNPVNHNASALFYFHAGDLISLEVLNSATNAATVKAQQNWSPEIWAIYVGDIAVQPAWTTPVTFADGGPLAAAVMNAQFRDNPQNLHDRNAALLWSTQTVSPASNTWTPIANFDAEFFCTDPAMHSTVTNPGRLIFPGGGLYLVGGFLQWSPNATNQRFAGLRKNGSTFICTHGSEDFGTAESISIPLMTLYNFAANDYIELAGFQNSGGALATESVYGQTPLLWGLQLG